MTDKNQINITNESELHTKVIDFFRKFYPQAIIVSGCVSQVTDKIRIQSKMKGYEAGQPDLLILNSQFPYAGMAIEFKTPTGIGKISTKQLNFLDRLRCNKWKCIVSNSYDEILVGIIRYFDAVEVDTKTSEHSSTEELLSTTEDDISK